MKRLSFAILICLLLCLCGNALAASYIPASVAEVPNQPKGIVIPSFRWEIGTYVDDDPDYGETFDAIFIYTDWEPTNSDDVVVELLTGYGDDAAIHYSHEYGCWYCAAYVDECENMTVVMHDGYYESARITSYYFSMATSRLEQYSHYADGYTFTYRADGSLSQYSNDYDDYTAMFGDNGQLTYYEYTTWGQVRYNIRNEMIYLWAEYDRAYEYRDGVWYVENPETWEYDIPTSQPFDYADTDFPPRIVGMPRVYTLPDGTLEISDGAFRGTPVTEVHIPAGCLTIGDNAFSDCTLLRELHIPESVTNIGSLSNVPNLTIYATKETAAHQYAITNEIPFIAE